MCLAEYLLEDVPLRVERCQRYCFEGLAGRVEGFAFARPRYRDEGAVVPQDVVPVAWHEGEVGLGRRCGAGEFDAAGFDLQVVESGGEALD